MNILQTIGNTPLVRLSKMDHGLRNQVYGKCEFMNPSGSVKDRIALGIVDALAASGELPPGGTLVEATAGNTGLGLAMVAAVRGYRLVVVMPEKMSVDKRQALRLLGAEVMVTGNHPSDHPENFKHVARSLANERGWTLTDQFAHPANIAAHETGTGQEIARELPQIGAFICGAGTGGTLTGVARVLRKACPKAKIYLADPVGSEQGNVIDQAGVEAGPYGVEGIGSSTPAANFHTDLVDGVIRVTDEQSYEAARVLMREEGLFVGGSAGTNVAAACMLANRSEVVGPVVTILCDSWDRYWSQPWMKGYSSSCPS